MHNQCSFGWRALTRSLAGGVIILRRCHIVACICGLTLQGCTIIDRNTSQLNKWASSARAAVPYLPAYRLHREQTYPLSSQASIYVGGGDQRLVDAFTRELRVYFSSVESIGANKPAGKQGFYFVLNGNGAKPAQSDLAVNPEANVMVATTKTADSNAAPAVQNPSTEPADARHLNIKITDLNSSSAFDRMTIDFVSSPAAGSAVGEDKLQRAFKDAAALLAGQS